MTGEVDYQTPIGEAEQFHRALKLRNVETVLGASIRGGHPIVNWPSHRMARGHTISTAKVWLHQDSFVSDAGTRGS
jgi:hypothetical protein